jgi:hypothetical protein
MKSNPSRVDKLHDGKGKKKKKRRKKLGGKSLLR